MALWQPTAFLAARRSGCPRARQEAPQAPVTQRRAWQRVLLPRPAVWSPCFGAGDVLRVLELGTCQLDVTLGSGWLLSYFICKEIIVKTKMEASPFVLNIPLLKQSLFPPHPPQKKNR